MSKKKQNSSRMPRWIVCTGDHRKIEVRDPQAEKPLVHGKAQDLQLIEKEGKVSYVKMGKKKFPVEIIQKKQNSYTISVNGVWHTLSVETPLSYRRRKVLRKGSEKQKQLQVRSPMPGKIIEVFVEEGAEVKSGEPLLILEAMKMQNEILSSVSGRINGIHVRAGDSVIKEDVLLEIGKD